MSNFQPAFHSFQNPSAFGSASALGAAGAPRKKHKKPVSDSVHAQIVKKYRWLRDENTTLEFAFDHQLGKKAKPVFRKLARMRDHFRSKAIRVLKGHGGGQITRRTLLALSTGGASELARLILKKPLAKAHKRQALRAIAKADACDALLRYWFQKFHKRAVDLKRHAAKGGKFKQAYTEAVIAARAADEVEQDGSTDSMMPESGDVDITETVTESETEDMAEEAAAGSDDEAEGDFGGLTGKQVLGFGFLGALAGLAVS